MVTTKKQGIIAPTLFCKTILYPLKRQPEDLIDPCSHFNITNGDN